MNFYQEPKIVCCYIERSCEPVLFEKISYENDYRGKLLKLNQSWYACFFCVRAYSQHQNNWGVLLKCLNYVAATVDITPSVYVLSLMLIYREDTTKHVVDKVRNKENILDEVRIDNMHITGY